MPTANQIAPLLSYDLTATIASGQTVSGVVDLHGNTLCGVFLDSAFDGTALGFHASADGTTFVEMVDGAGAALAVVVAASKFVPLDPADFAGVRHLKFTADSQTGATVITLATRPV